MLATFSLGRRGNRVPAGDAARNGLSQAVRRLRQRVLKVVSAGERFGKIREPHM
ncbi:MAG: hypothetical protein ABSH24_20605 [Bryobacteraceae bacterium]|jgi:hypothetical protein